MWTVQNRTQKIQTDSEGKCLKTVLQIRESTVGRFDQFGSNTSAISNILKKNILKIKIAYIRKAII